MRRLILMRHAKSDWSAGVTSDRDRPLNDRGRAGAVALGEWLRQQDLLPDQILCSSAQRTRETLAHLNLPEGIATSLTRDLYLATHTEMAAVLRGATGHTVLMLGHNPGTSILATQLLETVPDHSRFERYPTGATTVAEFDLSDWGALAIGAGQLLHFVTPHDLPAV